jgi:hypothetical protein
MYGLFNNDDSNSHYKVWNYRIITKLVNND